MANSSQTFHIKTSSLFKFSTFSVIFIAILSGIYINWPPPTLTEELYRWKENGNFFKFVDKYTQIPYQIFYRDDLGSGKGILLCLHGFPTSSYDWKKVYDGLKQQFSRIIAPDFIGMGFSQKPTTHHIIISSSSQIIEKEQNYSIFQQSDVIEALLHSLDITNVHILAHDYGDTVAQELTHRYNQNKKKENQTETLNITSLTLLNGGIIPDAHRPRLVQRLLLYPTVSSFVLSFMNYWIFKFSLSEVFGSNTIPSNAEFWDWWVHLRYNEGELALGKLIQYIPERHANKERWVRSLQECDFPVNMIYGKLDPVNPPPFDDYYRESFPRSTITVLHDVGHYVQWEAPTETIRLIKLFINSLTNNEKCTDNINCR